MIYEAIRVAQRYEISTRMGADYNWTRIGQESYRNIMLMRWCMECENEKANSDSNSGGGGTLFSKETIIGGG